MAFKEAIEAITDFSGGTELTFGGLLEALKQAACHNFIMVFTDEIGFRIVKIMLFIYCVPNVSINS